MNQSGSNGGDYRTGPATQVLLKYKHRIGSMHTLIYPKYDWICPKYDWTCLNG